MPTVSLTHEQLTLLHNVIVSYLTPLKAGVKLHDLTKDETRPILKYMVKDVEEAKQRIAVLEPLLEELKAVTV